MLEIADRIYVITFRVSFFPKSLWFGALFPLGSARMTHGACMMSTAKPKIPLALQAKQEKKENELLCACTCMGARLFVLFGPFVRLDLNCSLYP